MALSVNLDSALLYIDQHGNLQDKARLLHILLGEPPPDPAVRPLLDKQNADGGFPSRPRGDNPSSVDSTVTALWQLNELGLLGAPAALRAIDYLAAAQAPDGSWDENPALPRHDLPPWIVPGQMATRNYLTAYSAYWLALSGRARPALRRAAAFLVAQQAENGQILGYQHGHWIATGALLALGDEYTQNAGRAIAYLAARPWTDWQDSQIAWALDSLLSAGLPAGHPFAQAGLAELARRQEPGGSWLSEDGPAYAVSATLGALKVFQRAGLLTGY